MNLCLLFINYTINNNIDNNSNNNYHYHYLIHLQLLLLQTRGNHNFVFIFLLLFTSMLCLKHSQNCKSFICFILLHFRLNLKNKLKNV